MTSPIPHRRIPIAVGQLFGAVANVAGFAGGRVLPDRALRRLLAISHAFPGVAQSFGFEFRLRDDDDRVDFGVAIAPGDGGGAAFARSSPERDERWLRIARFARAWSEVGQPLQTWASFIFLEFDEESGLDPIPVPSVFVGLDSPIDGGSGSSPELFAAQHAASLLAASSGDDGRQALIAGAFSALPEGARVLHVAIMLGRADQSLRMSVLLPGSTIGTYLHRLGLPVAAGIAEAVQIKLGRLMDVAQLDFDLSAGASARIGFGLRPRQRQPSAWAELLDHLGNAVEFSKAKRDALMRWPGMSSYRAHTDVDAMLLRREISHLKLACSAEEDLQLKAYIGVAPLRLL